jgi:oligopeptide transport system substrate-binding protein
VHRYLRKGALVVLGAACVAALVIAAGCTPSTTTSSGSGSAASGPAKGGVLSFYIAEPEAIDPYNAQESEGVQVTQALFDSLTAVDPKTGRVIPAAADSWSSDASGTVWTFKLHSGAKFADGESVTAKDFVFAWNRIAESASTNATDASQIAYHLSPVVGFDDAQKKGTPMAGVKAIDDLTLQVTLSYPFADWPYVCSHPALAPVPEKLVTNGVPYAGKTVPFDQMPVGNGPFKMSQPWVHNQYIKVVRNDDYYGQKANLDAVNFRIFADLDTAYREFQAGGLDFTEIPPGQVAAAKQKYGVSADGYTCEPGHDVLTGPEAAIYYLSLDMKKPPLDNLKVREAISLAINRDAINQAVYEGIRQTATGYIPPGIPGYQPDQFPFSHYDMNAAKAALSAAGYPGGKGFPTIELAYNSGAGHAQVMQLVQSDLKAIGINTRTYTLQGAQYWPYLTTTKFQVARDGWIADYPIADNFTNPEFNSTADNNHSHYSNPQVDALILKARSTTDDSARIALYEQIQKMIGNDVPVVPIVYYSHNRVGSNRVHDLFYDNMGLTHFETVWLSAGAK